MKNFIHLCLTSIVLYIALSSCNTGGRGIFAEKTEREKYIKQAEKSADPALANWKRFGDQVLEQPLLITAPYAERGSFTGDSSDANALLFTVKPGQRIDVSLTKEAGSVFTPFIELWQQDGKLDLIKTADTITHQLVHATAKGGTYLLRLQPSMQAKGNYQLKIALSPILGFPIDATTKSSISSFWGADRDGGARRHEGIDIFAKKGSPVVAVSNGRVSRVSEGGIGGKVVWLQPEDESFSVYYAHLDTQFVESGQSVVKGQLLGTVGNTGNAKHTAAHLHFGIYTMGGAIDPLLFVQQVKEPSNAPIKKLQNWYKQNTALKIYPSPKKENALAVNKQAQIKTLSATNQFYRVMMSDGTRGFVAMNELSEKWKID